MTQTSARGQPALGLAGAPGLALRARRGAGRKLGARGALPRGGEATALFDVEPPAHPGAGIRGAPMSSNVRKFEEG